MDSVTNVFDNMIKRYKIVYDPSFEGWIGLTKNPHAIDKDWRAEVRKILKQFNADKEIPYGHR